MEWAVSERWLPVVGYEGAYEVSDKGRVRVIPVLKRLIFAAATSVVLAISTVSITVSDLAARGGYGDWPV